MDIRAGIELGNSTDVGCERQNNEDYYCYWEAESEEQFSRKGRLAIVADGMGGEEGGEIASRLAVDTVREVYLNIPDADPQAALLEGFQVAHGRILQCAHDHPELQGMGTTCTAVAIRNGQAYFAHVGDSRLYLARDSSIVRLTQDHTYVNRLIEHGLITSEEAAAHPQQHVLTAALGANRDVTADCSETPIPIGPGDVLVLCTDGLWGQVTDEELLSVIQTQTPSEACKELVRMAKARGGPDNITVQILRVLDRGERTKADGDKGRQP